MSRNASFSTGSFSIFQLLQSQSLTEKKKEIKMSIVLSLDLEINNHFAVRYDDVRCTAILCPSELLNIVLAQCHLSFPHQTRKLLLLFICVSGDGRNLES